MGVYIYIYIYIYTPLRVFKHVTGKYQAVKTLVQIILAAPLEIWEKSLRKDTRKDRVDYIMEGLEESNIVT